MHASPLTPNYSGRYSELSLRRFLIAAGLSLARLQILRDMIVDM